MTPVFGRLVAASVLVLGLVAGTAQAADPNFDLTIRDHKFEPDSLRVPANTAFTITVTNADPTPEEFETRSPKREKVIPGNSKGVVNFGPLKPGTYPFVGEFHERTAKGKIVVE
jgi:plastocyanin